MSRILLMATTTGYQTRAFGEAAERLDADLVFATDRCDQIDDPWRDGAIPIRFHEEDRSIAAIVAAARAQPIAGIVAVGDRPTVIAAGAAAALDLPWHPPAAAAAARHKLRTRECLRDAGLPVPWFVPWSVRPSPEGGPPSTLEPWSLELLAVGNQPLFPCVIKPVALSGSRGVIRADDRASLQAAAERLRALLDAPDIRAERDPSHDLALVEGFIVGREYAVEALMHRGELHVLAIFDKPDPLDGPFFEETIYVTPSSAPAAHQRAIVEAIAKSAKAIGLWHGPLHAECRVSAAGGPARVFVLEAAARPIGGLCARALRFTPAAPRMPSRATAPVRAGAAGLASGAFRISLEELLLRHALGGAPDAWVREPEASGVMMIPIPRRGTFRGIDGLDAARAVDHVAGVQITAKPEQLLVPLPEGASYLGFIFARASTPAEVERALHEAHGRLRVRVEVEFPVLAGSHLHYNSRHG
jgi:hypothetical protein